MNHFSGKTKKRHRKSRVRVVIYFGVILIILSVIYFINPFSSFSRMMTWTKTRESRLHQKFLSVKKLVLPESTKVADIRFEFYTALPALEIATSNNVLRKEIKNPSSFLSNPDEMMKTYVRKMPEKGYIIQVGVFKDILKAKMYRAYLSKQGFHAVIAKVHNTAHQLYRVQIGPFLSEADVKKTRQRLQGKGIESLGPIYN
ncbi:MAG: hypothetical protein A3F12_06130 [Gammaproteobacteria bacterium RIFCSPHIGHO2_12_FULL_38_14]|nr:MAG: hypothetical protein A3F12_06130 [Gammaproteobacteria bacterium RIFCSPHIGHO2_12_FULL_38_14]